MKFNSKKILLTALGILVFLIFFKFFSIISFPDSQTVLEKGDPLKIYHDQAFHQTFVANRDGLSRIEFLLRTPGPNKDDTVRVTLSDETCTTAERQGTLAVPFLNADNLYVVTFPPVQDSDGKKYCAIVSYEKANTSTRYLRFFTTENKNEDMSLALATTGEVTKNQSLAMRLVYNNKHWWQDLRELDQRISQYKPWFLKHFYIASIAVLFVGLSLTLIIALITLPSEEKRD
ncbi:MAG: hypothetical protein WAV46_03690 [Candidatus Moraniibacteriota bacterium]